VQENRRWTRLKTVPSRPLTRADVGELVERIRQLLADPDTRLAVPTRQRWEGALTALEAVLGEAPSLVDDTEL
jgi:hypothetical protein